MPSEAIWAAVTGAIGGAGVMRLFDKRQFGWRPKQVKLVRDNIALSLLAKGALERMDEDEPAALEEEIRPTVHDALGEEFDVDLTEVCGDVE
jgi:hypothetical protein